MKVLGIDFGTTSFSGCVYDNKNEEMLFMSRYNSSCKVSGLKREFEIEKVRNDFQAFTDLLKDNFDLSKIEGISVTGNMHSFFLVKNKKPITNIISWQDERVLEEYRNGLSYIDYINKNYKELFSPYQHLVSPGYAVTTLLHIIESNNPDKLNSFSDCSIHFAPDFVVQELLGDNLLYNDNVKGVTDPSLAHSSGLYNLKTGDWNYSLIDALGYNEIKFPQIMESGSLIGYVGEKIPLLQGVPVFLGMGDNQASVYGALMDLVKREELNNREIPIPTVLSIGTSGQISAVVKSIKTDSNCLDYRPFINNSFLLVGASLSSGKTMETMKDFIKAAAYSICKKDINDQKAYDIMKDLILADSPLKFQTTLNGTRYQPNMRGSIKNIDLNNFSLDNVITAAAYGIVEELYSYYKEMNISCDNIIGVGNGLRKNKYFLEIIKNIFNKDVYLSEIKETGSFGAAVCALQGKNKL